MSDVFAELEWRGFVQQATPGLNAQLAKGPLTVYCGFDPTAPSLQIGNLMPLMLLRHFQRAGHKPIVLMGGGTGLIGDPSGKRNERPLLSKDDIRAHLHHQRDQMQRFLDFDVGPVQALVLNNADWLGKETLIDFLRDVGKHFTVNVMMQKESVQGRMEAGISYTEFSYMLLQAFDFLHLYRTHRCTLQVGGSDQWGNITAGVDLIRRVEGGEAHGLVAPLVTTASGAKFGKSEAGAIWLDPVLTTPYKFYQFWVNADDRDVEAYLRLFTERAREGSHGIDALVAMHKQDPGKREAQYALANDVSELVHGRDATRSAVAVSAILFNNLDPRQQPPDVFRTLANEIPTARASRKELSLVEALTEAGLVKSKSEARRAIEQGGVYVNQQRAADDRPLGSDDWIHGNNVVLRKGKKDYALLLAG